MCLQSPAPGRVSQLQDREPDTYVGAFVYSLECSNLPCAESGTLETIYTLVELFLAIMCASVVLMRPAVQLCLRGCGCFPRRGPTEKPSSPSSDFAHLFPEFVYGTDLNTCSQDAYSEVRTRAYRTPTLEMSQNLSDLAVHGIVVETSIDRDVRDREAILATIGDMGSIGRSTFGGSVRTGSVGSLHK